MVSSTTLDKKAYSTTAYNQTTANSSSAAANSSTTTTILLKPSATGIDELESPLNTLNEKISILFPKCKPKHDQNANPTMKSMSSKLSGQQLTTSSLSDTSSSTLTNTLEPANTSVAAKISRSPALQHRKDDEEEIISNYIETNPFRIGQNGGAANVSPSTFNSATLSNSLFGGDKYYYSQHSRSHFNNNIFGE
jgi:hypothetical protein